MIPTGFPEQNKTLTKPRGMEDLWESPGLQRRAAVNFLLADDMARAIVCFTSWQGVATGLRGPNATTRLPNSRKVYFRAALKLRMIAKLSTWKATGRRLDTEGLSLRVEITIY